jgi:HlyD family secretion protein
MDQENKETGQVRPDTPESTETTTPEVREPGSAPSPLPMPAPPPKLPVPVPKRRPRRRWRSVLVVLAMLAGGAGGGFYWWQHSQSQLPAGIAWGNGRIEADEIDIDTKFAGRIDEMVADEGDMVKAGQVVARMDTRDLKASLKRSEALVQQAQRTIDEAEANVVQQKSQVLLAKQELDRTAQLVKKGFATNELLDQRRQQVDGANAALNAAQAKVVESQNALDAATHDVELYRVNIADNTLVAPRDGRIQYRVANIGEVLPAGGKVFTMLDIAYVYMDIYLPTAEAGKTRVGTDARIVLDAYPNISIPAKVSFVATQAQFTPKTVETQSERDKLMFRVRVKIDPELLRPRAERVRSGLPGIAYVKFDPQLAWPPQLQGNVPK